jgi:hypothetical protein
MISKVDDYMIEKKAVFRYYLSEANREFCTGRLRHYWGLAILKIMILQDLSSLCATIKCILIS